MFFKEHDENLRKCATAFLVAISIIPLLRLSTQIIIPLFEDVIDDPVGIAEYGAVPAKLTFDFVVVGGGTAGCAVAARLSEDPNVSVLLLEAGGDGTMLADVPLFAYQLFNSPEMDYVYKTTPDGRNCLGMRGGACVWHRGRVIGGSSNVHAMMYHRGNRLDYDYWASIGNYGWESANVLNYFKKLEDFRDPVAKRDKKYHSRGGPLAVEKARYQLEVGNTFLEAAQFLGLKISKDFAGEDQEGFGWRHQMTRDGYRASSSNSYLKDAKRRPNLTILLRSQALKIHLGRGRAKGVLVRRGDRVFSTFARREVILSAGAVESPKLLMLSGIGPGEHLQEMGIPAEVDLPVGRNMQSHIGLAEPTFTLEVSVAFSLFADLANPLNYVKYALWGEGPFRKPAAYEASGFYKTGTNNDSWPDVQIFFISGHKGSDGGIFGADMYNHHPDQQTRYNKIAFKHGFSIVSCLLHPKSRGTISLRSRNPEDPPNIQPNYFSDPDDLRDLVIAADFAMRFGMSKPFEKHGVKHFSEPVKGCEHTHIYSTSYWKCVAGQLTHELSHDVATCPMGLPDDPRAVTDPELRVYGVPNLRIVDLSVMPEVISGNTATPAMMIGERAAEMIKRDYGMLQALEKRPGIPQHKLLMC